MRLLARTTRTVAPTEAGERLLAQLRPALQGIAAALAEVGRLRASPAGVVRLIAPPMVLATVARSEAREVRRDYPDVSLDVASEDDTRRDLVAGRFDAGIHLGEFLQRDMVAVKVTREQRAAVVAAPAYFESHPKPKTPRDLTAHRCLRYRMGSERARLPLGVREARQAGDGVRLRAGHRQRRAEFMIRAALDGVGWPTRSRSTSRSTSRGESSCAFSRTGVRRSTATSSTTRAGVTSRRPFRRWSTRSASDLLRPPAEGARLVRAAGPSVGGAS